MRRSLLLFVTALVLNLGTFCQTLENTLWNVSTMGVSLGDFVFQGGQLSMYVNGFTMPIGTYTVSGNSVTVTYVNDMDCTSPGTYSYQIVGNTINFTLVSDPCEDRVPLFVDFTWAVSPNTSIATHEAVPGLEVHPVPARDRIFLNRSQPGAMTVNIHTMTGQLVYQEQITGVRHDLDLGALPAGNYILQAVTPEGKASRRIVLE
jgi:hypothetical protein